MDITASILSTASRIFGISALKPYQLLVIQRIMEQEDLYEVRDQLVILPTGTGKSLCFLVPAVMCSGITVIVYPILALMNDQRRKLDKAGIRSVCIRGGMTQDQRVQAFRELDSGTKIVLTTPESLSRPGILWNLSRRKVSLLVVDEAHVISQWGKDFRPAYLELINIAIRLRPHQVLAFTATASEQTIRDIRRHLFLRRPLVVKGDADRPNIIYFTYPTLSRTQALVTLARTCQKPALVFCRTRPEARTMCQRLLMEIPGLDARYYHAGLSREERESLEDWFLNSRDGVLLATSAYGMGVDKPDIRTIVHHRLPQTVEEYLQESGRAGRDGDNSIAYVIVTLDDRTAKAPYSPVLGCFTSRECRRHALLLQMGQNKNECTGCDICLGKEITELQAQRAILALIRRWPFRFTSTMASYLLCGCRNRSMCRPQVIFNPLYESIGDWNPRLLAKTIDHLSSPSVDFPVSSVHFCTSGKLLYPSKHLLYNLIARILRRIDHGYNWTVRKARGLKDRGEKIRGAVLKALGNLRPKG